MNCAEFEILLCDYVDGSLDAGQRSAFEGHQRECVHCAGMARDVTSAVSFMERAAVVEPPPELLTRIAFHIPQGRSTRSGLLGRWLQPVLQPRFAMGMAMTILSFSMLGRFAGIEPRQLKPADLHPAKVWAVVDDKVHRGWARAVKYYESLRLVYELQERMQQWSEQEQERGSKTSTAAAPPSSAPVSPEKKVQK